MRPITRLVQFEPGAARDDLFAELDESVDYVAQVEQFGPSAANVEHIGREARLSGRVPPKLVEHHVRSGVALQVDDNAHAQPIGLVANVGNALDPFVLGRFGDFFYQTGFADLIGNFGQYHGSAVAAPFLDFVARAHDDRSEHRLIGRKRARLAEGQPARRDTRAGNDLEQFIHSYTGSVYNGQ